MKNYIMFINRTIIGSFDDIQDAISSILPLLKKHEMCCWVISPFKPMSHLSFIKRSFELDEYIKVTDKYNFNKMKNCLIIYNVSKNIKDVLTIENSVQKMLNKNKSLIFCGNYKLQKEMNYIFSDEKYTIVSLDEAKRYFNYYMNSNKVKMTFDEFRKKYKFYIWSEFINEYTIKSISSSYNDGIKFIHYIYDYDEFGKELLQSAEYDDII